MNCLKHCVSQEYQPQNPGCLFDLLYETATSRSMNIWVMKRSVRCQRPWATDVKPIAIYVHWTMIGWFIMIVIHTRVWELSHQARWDPINIQRVETRAGRPIDYAFGSNQSETEQRMNVHENDITHTNGAKMNIWNSGNVSMHNLSIEKVHWRTIWVKFKLWIRKSIS